MLRNCHCLRHILFVLIAFSYSSAHRAARLSLLAAFITFLPPAFAAKESFSIEDYFSIKRITELALSSDGEMMAYAVESESLEENKTIRSVYVSMTAPNAKPIVIDKIQNARNFAWIPGAHDLAYLSGDNGVTQLYSMTIKTQKIRQHTTRDNPVTAFRFSLDGTALAWLTQGQPSETPSPLYERLFSGEEGVVIESDSTVVYHFVNPDRGNYLVPRPASRLWVKLSEEIVEIAAPGRVSDFHWSLDGSKLSVVYVDASLSEDARIRNLGSIGIYDVAGETFDLLAAARPASGAGKARYYAGGEWTADGRMHLRRLIDENAWVSTAEWALVDPSHLTKAEWRPIAHGREDTLIVADPSRLYVQKIVNAVDALYELTPKGLTRAELLRDLPGAAKSVRFSGDFKTAAFVHESLTAPPEIYVWRKGEGLKKLTQLNQAIAAKVTAQWREISWKSKDGATVRGWLIEPTGAGGRAARPLITHVHGGPGSPMRNDFARYFGLWPYPFLAYVANDMSVFFPNYRGTRSFGDKHRAPKAHDGEPVDDITSGVKHLIREGIADPNRLAISGHSHGAWLAPLAMTRSKMFQAGSFAEGTQNKIINYSLMPGWLNRVTHDVQYGVSLYNDPQRYIDMSPDLHMKGLDAAVLFEAGAKSLAINMMGSPKAAARAGMPAEFVVYPKTGHNLSIPHIQRESAERNLDWFRFWLQGYEDRDREKAERYARWRKMRDKRCAREDLDTPSYCNQ